MRPLPTLYHAPLTRYDDAKFRHIPPRNCCWNDLTFYHFCCTFSWITQTLHINLHWTLMLRCRRSQWVPCCISEYYNYLLNVTKLATSNDDQKRKSREQTSIPDRNPFLRNRDYALKLNIFEKQKHLTKHNLYSFFPLFKSNRSHHQ